MTATRSRVHASPTVVQQAVRLLTLRDSGEVEDDELVQHLGRLFWAAFDVDYLRNRIDELEGR